MDVGESTLLLIGYFPFQNHNSQQNLITLIPPEMRFFLKKVCKNLRRNSYYKYLLSKFGELYDNMETEGIQNF